MKKMMSIGLLVVLGLAMFSIAVAEEWKSGIPWEEPKVVTPGTDGGPPSDAIVLFDGKDLASHWNGADKWAVEDGYAYAKGGGISTKEDFGSCQLHVEFCEPEDDNGTGQGRGNSGIYFLNNYEVQVLDSYENETYFDGQCASLYKQSPRWSTPAASPASGRPTTSSLPRPSSIRTARSLNRHVRPCCRTVCWCRTL